MKNICVIDDDPVVLRALTRLLGSAGFAAHGFDSPQQFFAQTDLDTVNCVVVDFAMPFMNGLQVQQTLHESFRHCPVIFLTGRADISTSVQAMKAGAIDFLVKPVDADTLIEAVHNALAYNATMLVRYREWDMLNSRYINLTRREQQVFSGVITGQLNKQIAADLGTSEKTIKAHRAQVMQKMAASSLAELVHFAERLRNAGVIGTKVQ
ncbi:MAG: response regulator [Spongiibacteraceae bacterium]